MTTTDMTETTALILTGQGYELLIAPEAEAKKLELLGTASAVLAVHDNDESAAAQRVARSLAQMRIEVEKSRKTIKEPVNRIGKLIDETAKTFLAELNTEESRINKLVGNHAMEVARLKAAAEAAERKAFDDARRAREEAERAAAAAATTGKISDVLAARQAEKDRQDALASRMAASTEVATTKVAEGVRFAIDFEVVNAELTLKEQPNLVDLTIRRADTLAYLKAMETEGIDIEALGPVIGLKVFKKPVVSSR